MSILLDNARRYAAQARPFKADERDLRGYAEGKAFAVEIVDAAREPDAQPRLVFVAVGMAAMSRDEAFVAGFYAELQRQLAEGKR